MKGREAMGRIPSHLRNNNVPPHGIYLRDYDRSSIYYRPQIQMTKDLGVIQMEAMDGPEHGQGQGQGQ